MNILFEDNHQLVVVKPAGIVTQPSGVADRESLEMQAKEWLKQKYQKKGNVFLEAVHRIDKPVSGIVLFAKTSKALSRLHASMREKKVKKTYLAIVEGHIQKKEGTLIHDLVHDEHFATVAKKGEEGKQAVLHYKVLESYQKTDLVEIALETGRYHQIRAQFAAIGHPILGDAKYGSKNSYQPDAIALHHSRFEIPHPITGEWQVFEFVKKFE